jgi:hypothetical protein
MTINDEPPAPGKPLLRAGLPTRAALRVPVLPALAETPEEIEAERAVGVLDIVTVIGTIEDPRSTHGSAFTLTERELEKLG